MSVLTLLMSGLPAPRAERREGYVSLAEVLTLVGQIDDRTARAIDELKTIYRQETQAMRTLVETYRHETNQRLTALEAWREAQDDAELIRQGKAAVTFGLLRILAANWQLVWALVVLVLGLVMTLTGGPEISVGPPAGP